MAIVWRALDRKLGREVALKEVRAQLKLDSEGLARSRREAETVAKLSSPASSPIFDLEPGTSRVDPCWSPWSSCDGRPLSLVLKDESRRPALRTVLEAPRGASRRRQSPQARTDHRGRSPGPEAVERAGHARRDAQGVRTSGSRTSRATTRRSRARARCRVRRPTWRPSRRQRGSPVGRRPTFTRSAPCSTSCSSAGRPTAVGRGRLAQLWAGPPRLLKPCCRRSRRSRCALRPSRGSPPGATRTRRRSGPSCGDSLDGEPILARPIGHVEVASVWFRRNRRLAVALVVVGLAVASGALPWASRLLEARRRLTFADEAIARALEGRTDVGTADRLAAIADAATVARLGAALDEVTAELLRVRREAALEARDPTPDEAAAGQEPIRGLDAAVAKWVALVPPDGAEARRRRADRPRPATAVRPRRAQRPDGPRSHSARRAPAPRGTAGPPPLGRAEGARGPHLRGPRPQRASRRGDAAARTAPRRVRLGAARDAGRRGARPARRRTRRRAPRVGLRPVRLERPLLPAGARGARPHSAGPGTTCDGRERARAPRPGHAQREARGLRGRDRRPDQRDRARPEGLLCLVEPRERSARGRGPDHRGARGHRPGDRALSARRRLPQHARARSAASWTTSRARSRTSRRRSRSTPSASRRS